ncbi:hypothetical protein NYQ83_02635 [Afifella sp. JA880]|uniref:hypothetical protein n=1 Tax=Afifella sp. JA880 TaxID=2975280 RepID=UPI0021BB0371|nr:hypothetical protein [Afifella sp. JA880]MCT8266157.1 hypothetical protein [Afifella sp. JA880]
MRRLLAASTALALSMSTLAYAQTGAEEPASTPDVSAPNPDQNSDEGMEADPDMDMMSDQDGQSEMEDDTASSSQNQPRQRYGSGWGGSGYGGWGPGNCMMAPGNGPGGGWYGGGPGYQGDWAGQTPMQRPGPGGGWGQWGPGPAAMGPGHHGMKWRGHHGHGMARGGTSFRLRQGDTTIRVTCSPKESAEACASAAAKLMEAAHEIGASDVNVRRGSGSTQ